MEVGNIGNGYSGNYINEAKSKAADDSFEKRLQNAVNSNDDKELKKVCKEFEGILLNMMYKQMKATVPKYDITGEDSGRDIFESMLDEKLMDQVSRSQGIGLGDMLYKQMSKRLKSVYKVED